MKLIVLIFAIIGICISKANAYHGSVYIGCYNDAAKRVLNASTTTFTDNTPAKCIHYCSCKGYAFAGVENGNQCYCGNQYATLGLTSSPDQCCNKCPGNSDLICGGTLALSVYSTAAIGPSENSSISYFGCFNDAPCRAFDGAATNFSDNTPAKCIAFCQNQGYPFAGVEFGNMCFCGSSAYGTYGAAGSDGRCNMPCPGDSSKKCGGFWCLSVYGTSVPTCPSQATTTTTTTTALTSINIASTLQTRLPSTVLQTSPVNGYLGCYIDSYNRDLNGSYILFPTNNSPIQCAHACKQKGFAYAGCQSATSCWCGNSYGRYGKAPSESDCNLTCPGDSSCKCGGSLCQNIYQTSYYN